MNYAMKTTNKSFINMWRYLQRNKIENNLFMLQTKSKDLVDFSIEKYHSMDKDDPSFSIYRSKVIDEAKENIWFYFRELVMVPDESTITGYKHFELTPEFMLMIYLYDKQKSFINLNTDNELCLQFLWNRFESLYNSDIVLINDIDTFNKISNSIKRYISQMECQVPIGSTQIISDSCDRTVLCNNKVYKELYLKNRNASFLEYITGIHKNFIQKNNWIDDNSAIFILEKDMNILTYSYIMNLLKNTKFRLYLNGISNVDSMDRLILYNFLSAAFSKADTYIYDIDDSKLNTLYLI